MRALAIYGKGGIGKSTITANVSVALAEAGYRVLQIGCDPKHDSTRLLLGGFTQSTVLELMKLGGSPELTQVVMTGYKGIKCIEAGGPEPGVGCAGRGIISMGTYLKNSGLKLNDFDFVTYDVLGDVVCGGFGVPMRNDYSNEVYIVSSGEFMAVYAANNISKGIRNFSNPKGKLGGLIGNQRGVKGERELLEELAQRLGSQLLTFVPRNELFREAELNCMTVMEYAPNSDIADLFRKLARTIANNRTTILPSPLSEDELEELNLKYAAVKTVRRSRSKPSLANVTPLTNVESTSFKRYLGHKRDASDTGDFSDRPALHGCALAGAFNITSQVGDAVTIMHAPAGCAHWSFAALMSVGARSSTSAESHLLPNLLCTNILEDDVVFGGEKTLEELILATHAQREPKAFFLITSCPVSIIGDDWAKVTRRVQEKGIRVVYVDSEGIIAGDYHRGMLNAYKIIADTFIRSDLAPEEDSVNIVGERNVSTTVEKSFDEMKEILDDLQLRLNCRFVRETSVGEIANFKKGSVNVLAGNDPVAFEVKNFLSSKYGAPFLESPPPLGFYDTEDFVRRLASEFSRDKESDELVSKAKRRYWSRVDKLKRTLSGKKMMIFSYAQNLDWLLSTLRDVEAKIVKVCLYDSCIENTFRSRFDDVPVETGYDAAKRLDDIQDHMPDLVLTNYVPKETVKGVHYDVLPLCPPNGFQVGLDYAEAWSKKMRVPFMEGWREDAKLFNLTP